MRLRNYSAGPGINRKLMPTITMNETEYQRQYRPSRLITMIL